MIAAERIGAWFADSGILELLFVSRVFVVVEDVFSVEVHLGVRY